MNTYIYVLRLIERLYDDSAWTSEDEKLVSEHFHRLKADTEKGKVILAGKTERTDEYGFGIVIFREDSYEKAKEYAMTDPAVLGGIMTMTLERYSVALMRCE